MWTASALVLLAAAGFAAPLEAGNIHHKTARCLASGGPECDAVCLVCHPGVPGREEVRQEWNPSGATLADLAGGLQGGGEDETGDAPVCLGCHETKTGADNHPAGVLYPRDDRRYAWVPAGPKLFCDEERRECRIYCSTCHNPHAREPGLLRMSNRGSALCLSCHIK